MIERTQRSLTSRRGFLRTLGLVASAGLIQACAPAAPAPSKPAEPAKPAEAAKPAESKPAAPAATSAPPLQPAKLPRPRSRRSAAGGQTAPAAAKPGGTMVAGWDSDPGALDNNLDRGAVTRTLLHMVYDRIVERDISVKADFPPFGPGLATSWEVSPDAKVYTFKLRQGVKFHDGTPVDAEAIKFNIERNWNPNHPFYHKAGAGANALGYKDLDKVEVVDASTVRVTHKAPFADFLNVLAFGTYSIGSPTQIQKVGNDEFGNQPVGSGPFKYVVARARRQDGVREATRSTGAARRRWTGSSSGPLPEAVARLTALETGEVDWTNNVHPDSIEKVRANPNLVIELAQLPNTWGYIPNHRAEPTKNVKVRQALNWAVNREALAKDIMKGLAVPATSPFAPTGTAGHNPNIKGYSFDPAKAKALLAEGGYKGEELRFQIPQGAVGSPFAVQMNEYLQQNFKDVGINVKIEALEAQVMQQNLSNGMPNDVHAYSVGFSVDEMVNLQRHYRSDLVPPNGNTNPGWIESPELDAMLKKALETSNEEERKKIYFEVQQQAVDQAAWVWVVHQKGARAWSKKVQGFVNPNSYMFTFKTVSMG